MLVYLAGPMAGKIDNNRPLFAAVAAGLRRRGYVIISPAETFADSPTPRPACMRVDLSQLLAADAICLLPGWQYSRGAFTEYLVAVETGKKTFEAVGILSSGQMSWSMVELPRYDWSSGNLRWSVDRDAWSVGLNFAAAPMEGYLPEGRL